MQGPAGVGEDAGQASFEPSREGDEGLDAAFEGAREPALPGLSGVLFGAVAPQALEVVLEDVDGPEAVWLAASSSSRRMRSFSFLMFSRLRSSSQRAPFTTLRANLSCLRRLASSTRTR